MTLPGGAERNGRETRAREVPSARRASVVIPCRNEERSLERLLDAVRTQDVAIHEVIVVDNNSTDGSRDVVNGYQNRHPGWPLHLVTCSTPGAAAAMNAGIARATGDVIVRLDGHSIPQPDYVRLALGTLEREGVGVVGGLWQIEPGGRSRTAAGIAAAVSHPLGTGNVAYRARRGPQGPGDADTVPFGCFRTALWRDVGGYDESLQVVEDGEFNHRVRQAGWRVVLNPGMRCIYYARESFGRLAVQYSRYGWWKARMLRKHPAALQPRQVIPSLVVAGLAGLGLGALFLNAARVWLVSALAAYVLVVAVASIQQSWRARDARIAPAAAIAFSIVHFCWGCGMLLGLIGSRRRRD